MSFRLGLAFAFLTVLSLLRPTLAAEPMRLSHVAEKIQAGMGLTIVAFGSSSTEGIGASSARHAYPSLLPKELARLLPGHPPAQVLNRGVGGEQIDDMMRRLQSDVLNEHPDLVIWQMGTNDAMQHMPLAHFTETAREGIARLQSAGIDVLLMEPQESPILESVADMALYRKAIRNLGKEFHIPVLRRYDLMLVWLRHLGPVILASDNLHMSDIGYALLAKATARAVVHGAKRPS